jgi:hypothetical protein
MNGQSRNTGSIGYTRHTIKTNKQTKIYNTTQNRKLIRNNMWRYHVLTNYLWFCGVRVTQLFGGFVCSVSWISVCFWLCFFFLLEKKMNSLPLHCLFFSDSRPLITPLFSSSSSIWLFSSYSQEQIVSDKNI